MSTNENMPLEQMMSRAPRTGSGVNIDLTVNNQNPQQAAPNPNNDTETKQYKATAVNVGPVNFEDMQSVDIRQILPSKPANVSVENNPLMNELDMAVDREIERISRLHDEIASKQEEELQEIEDREAVAAQAIEDSNNVASDSFISDDEDDDLGLYETEDVPNDHHFPMIHNNHGMFPEDRSDLNMTNEVTNKTDDLPFEMSTPSTQEVAPETAAADFNVEGGKPSITVAEPSIRILDSTPNEDLIDEEDADNPDSNDSDSNEIFENLKAEVKEKITPIRNKINLSAFTIAKKSQSAQKVMRLAVQTHRNVADWVMYSAERPISVTGLSGPEILKLNPENSGRNRLNTFRDMYRVIYDHVYDANKPDFETWMKQVRFNDLQHIYFAIYMATFGGSNFLSYSCPNSKCNKVFIKDVEFKDMVKYASDEAKQKVQSILKLDSTSPSKDTYPVDLVQISDSYVFGLRMPSVWNVIIETASLSDKFLEKHGDLIDVVAYIDSIYYIDSVNQQLIPVDTKPDPNDQAKTSARRIKVFYDIIQQLTSEEYFNLGSEIKKYDSPSDQVTYQIPACTCPDCATEIPVNDKITPDSMLFTRHQLAAIGNM